MYAFLWRLMPGPIWCRLLVAVVLVIAVIALCFTVVFPVVDQMLAPSETFDRG